MPALFPSRGFRRTRERASGLLFALGVDDLSAALPTGQTLSLTRATGRTVFDSAGRVCTLAHSQVPWSAVYNSTEGVWEPVLDTQEDRTNLCLQSENFGTTWAAIGTPTRTAAALTCGDLSLDLIGDDAAGTLEGYSQAITFTGNGTKAVSLFIKPDTSTSAVIRLRDTTASANRLLMTVTWSGGVPSVATTTGTYAGAQLCANGVYRLLFRTGSVTAANTNQIEIYPATTSALAVANTGRIYVGGVQAENYDYPRAYVRTTTATVTHNSDAITLTNTFLPQTMSIYLRLERPAWSGIAPSTSSNVYISIGTAGTAGQVYIIGLAGSVNLRAAVVDGATTLLSADVARPATDVLDMCAQFDALTTAPRCRLDVGSGFGSWSSTGTGFSAWNNNTIALGPANGGIRRLIIAPGARTLSEMRGLAV